jgi:large subunit ribosomal protein L25
MKTVSLSGSLRANVGKSDANALRAKGQVPCVIYGSGEQIHFSADERAFKDVIFTPDTNIIDISLDGKNYKTVLQESQYHKITDKLIHADFLQIVEGKPVTVQLPVKTVGQAEGVKDGGKLYVRLRKLKVRGLINKLPQRVELNIDKLTIGKSISAGDINIDGVAVLHPKNVSVVSVQITRAVAVEETTTAVAGATTTPAAGATTTPAAGATTPAAGAKAATPAKDDKKK